MYYQSLCGFRQESVKPGRYRIPQYDTDRTLQQRETKQAPVLRSLSCSTLRGHLVVLWRLASVVAAVVCCLHTLWSEGCGQGHMVQIYVLMRLNGNSDVWSSIASVVFRVMDTWLVTM